MSMCDASEKTNNKSRCDAILANTFDDFTKAISRHVARPWSPATALAALVGLRPRQRSCLRHEGRETRMEASQVGHLKQLPL